MIETIESLAYKSIFYENFKDSKIEGPTQSYSILDPFFVYINLEG